MKGDCPPPIPPTHTHTFRKPLMPLQSIYLPFDFHTIRVVECFKENASKNALSEKISTHFVRLTL